MRTPASPTKPSLLDGIDIAGVPRPGASRPVTPQTRWRVSGRSRFRYIAYALLVLGTVAAVAYFATQRRIPARESGLIGPQARPTPTPHR